MSGTSKSTQATQTNQNTNQQTNQSFNNGYNNSSSGWGPAMDAISSLLPNLSNAASNAMGTNPAQSNAYSQLVTNALGTQSYAPQATSLANDLLGGGTSTNAQTMNDAYSKLQGTLNPYMNAAYLDPTTSPGMQSVLQTIQQDVGNQVNGMYAGAGRDLSGLNQQDLARGIAQGEAVPLLNQYNANVAAQQGAAGTLYNAGNTTAAGLQGLTQQNFANRAQGLDTGINGVTAATNAPAMNVINATTAQQQAPLTNASPYLGILGALAGLGQTSTGTNNGTGTSTGTGTTSGTSNTQGTQTMSPFQMAMMGLGGVNSFGQGLNGAGTGLTALSKLFAL